MTASVKHLVAAANDAVPRISPEDARKLAAEDDALIVDVRDGTEVAQSGKIEGAKHVSRGMIEFRADPASPSHDEAFSTDKPVIVYCASGGRASLAGKALKDLGYKRVYNLGGFADAVKAGMPTEP